MKRFLFAFCNRSTRIILAVFICVLTLAIPAQPVSANGAPPPEPSLGGAAPYQPQKTNVQMMSETVILDMLPNATVWGLEYSSYPSVPNQIRVNASFTMRNQSDTEEKMQVVFPLTHLEFPSIASNYAVIRPSFVAKVDGQSMPITEISTPPDLSNQEYPPPNGTFLPEVEWAAFDATFPPHTDVLMEVEYWMDGGGEALHSIDYIIETGAGWYGRILSADIIVRLPYPATTESVLKANPGYSFVGNEVRWKLKNIEPKREDNLSISVINTNLWPEVLELRARVAQVPQDANSWYKLSEKYQQLGFWNSPAGLMVNNQHLLDLAIQASKKAVALRPDWGDAHLQLAKILWQNHPRIANRYIGTRATPEVSVNDPTVQLIIKEIGLAEQYGVNSNTIFVYEINQFIPGVKLTIPKQLPTASPTALSHSVVLQGTWEKTVAIAAGGNYTCIVTSNNQSRCHINNQNLPVTDGVSAVAVGKNHLCIITTNNKVQCNGENKFGQLGDGTGVDHSSFADVSDLTNGVKTIVAGDDHTCVLTTEGTVRCWGRNYFGQLGNGNTAYSLIPVNVSGLNRNVTTLAGGKNHTCAFLIDGSIKCWGANDAGQLGDGTRVDRSKPVTVSGLPEGVIMLAGGLAHTCALTAQGEVFCWGDGGRGQSGPDAASFQVKPVKVSGLENNIRAITAGQRHTCALTNTGTVKCWGRNNLGQLGNGSEELSAIPVDVYELSGVFTIATGSDHTCAVIENNDVSCWGSTIFFRENTPIEMRALIPIEPSSTPRPTSTPRATRTITPTRPTNTPTQLANTPSATAKPSPSPNPTPAPQPAPASPVNVYISLGFAVLLLLGLLIFVLYRAKAGSSK